MRQNSLISDNFLQDLTKEQSAIVSRQFRGRESNLVVQAYAGTGKTHTLHSFARAHPDQSVHYLAFNRSMKEEAERKFKGMENVRVTTLHGLAFSMVGKNFADRLGEVNPMMLKPLVKKYFPSCVRGERKRLYDVTSAIRDAFQFFCSSKYESVAACFADRNYVQTSQQNLKEAGIDRDRLVAAVKDLWKNMTTGKGPCGSALPMTHNCYLKMFQLSHAQIGSDFVLIDEAQDVTDCMIGVVEGQKAHKIFIGDSYQQIYGWNGAVNSLQKLENDGADVLYLTQSFRCPSPVAKVADKYLQLLGAKKTYLGCKNIRPRGGPIAVLARSNAAIFREAYKSLCEGKKIAFLGGFEGYGFEILLDIWRIFGRHPEKVQDAWLKNMDFRCFDDLVTYANDHDTHLCAKCNLVKVFGPDVYTMYNRLKAGHVKLTQSDVVFSTVHKAKGAEWDKVILLDDFISFEKILLDICKNHRPCLLRKEELNLLYVATTRTRQNLRCPSSIILSDEMMTAIRQKQKENLLRFVA